MSIKIYNTLTRKKEIFNPIKKNKVGIYTCGPTVYYYAHIGNFRSFVFADFLKRTLKLNNYKVKHVINITDVGHLTSDGDIGDDKIEKEAKKQRKTPKQIADFYEKDFFKNFYRLNNEKPEITPRATEHIQDMIELIKKLEKNNYTYIGKNGNVYFDVSKFKNYGKLANLNLKKLKSGLRIELDKNKKNPLDFVLWFSEKGSKFKEHILKWKSPWGEGWPGWHIECSAMSMKYLGDTIDIHTGGEDHIPVHHTNEIAQSEGATGKKFVNYWMHVSFLQFNLEKMSKSKGEIIKVQDLLNNNYSPMHLRYFYLLGHYRKPLNFTWNNLEMAKKSYERLKKIIFEIKKDNNKKNYKNILMSKKQFLIFLNDDLNIPRALSYMWEILRDNKINNSEKLDLVYYFDRVFGLNLDKEEKIEIPKDIKELLKERKIAREKKDFKRADEIREIIIKKGFIIEDKKEKVNIFKK
jgi:cysteinyl-tRNA synthetase